jgi:prevent-host-death family protein
MSETGIRDLKTHLSRYLRQVEGGQTVVITRHGKPIGRIVPVSESTGAQLDTLRRAGLVAWNKQKLQPLAPVAQARGGRTVADLLLEDRE